MNNLFPTQYPSDFENFWALYPCKQGKAAALKAFKVAKLKVSFTAMLAAVGRYKAFLAANPKRDPLHASTWLNQERWADEYECRALSDTTSWKLNRAMEETMRRRMQ